jgi:hypothetical protein
VEESMCMEISLSITDEKKVRYLGVIRGRAPEDFRAIGFVSLSLNGRQWRCDMVSAGSGSDSDCTLWQQRCALSVLPEN